MARFLKDRKKKTGLPPGSLVYLADEQYRGLKITCITYNKEEFREHNLEHVNQAIEEAMSPGNITWIDIEGLSNISVMEEIGKTFSVSGLWLEDVLNTDHRPKVDELNDQMFFITKAVRNMNQMKRIFFEQVSVLMGDHFVLTFQEYPGDIFENLKNRIRNSRGRVREKGVDYLFYAITDAVVDSYYQPLEILGRRIEAVEQMINEELLEEIPQLINQLRGELLYLQRTAIPLRDNLSQLCRTKHASVREETREFFKDAHEHMIQIVEAIENYKSVLTTILDYYDGRMNHRLNETIKFLTVFSAVFIPLNLIASIYGMNFDYMPELKWSFGYPMTLTIMSVVSFGLLYYFKRRKWL